jgi:hypothetical protein
MRFTYRADPAEIIVSCITPVRLLTMSSLVTINVSGRHFQTSKATLITSLYFKNLFERWDTSLDQYIVDADSDIFEHLLCFMRRPSHFPLFWTKEKGFDYVLYNKLEAEADFFLLHSLRNWVRQERYKDAVKTVVEVTKIQEPPCSSQSMQWTEVDGMQFFLDSFKGEKTYRCPRDIHGPRAWDCGIGDGKCAELDRLHGAQYNNPEKYVVIVVERTVFDGRVCRNTKGI